jgi:hypothetical protein
MPAEAEDVIVPDFRGLARRDARHPHLPHPAAGARPAYLLHRRFGWTAANYMDTGEHD